MSDISENNQSSYDDLNWQAFLYVSGEMSDSEAAAFEDQLSPDSDGWNPAACKAVAEAVQLGDAVVRALDTVSAPATVSSETIDEPRTTTRRNRFAHWASLTAPTVAFLGVSWMFASLSSDAVVDVVKNTPASTTIDDADHTEFAGEMVRLWVESEIGLNPNDDEPQLLTAADVPEALVADVPDWLLAAVQSQQQSADGLSKPEVLEN